ncbi:MAG: flagellar hook-basal body complex protein [Pseudomonadota bacterium]
MSLSSGLNAGVAGLSVNATRLAAISDNIANSNTNGYRKTDVDFSSLVTASSGGSFTAGGVTVSTFRNVAQAGPIITSSSGTDIAVAGSGLLPVSPISEIDQPSTQRSFQMTATGSFRQNEDGFLVTPGGLALTGWPTLSDGTLATSVSRDSPSSLEPVRLSAFLTASDRTTQIDLGVNLPAIETLSTGLGNPVESPIEYFDALGLNHQLRIVYTPVVPATGSSNQWLVSFFDSATAEATGGTGLVGEFDVTFDGVGNGAGAVTSVTAAATNPVDPQGPGTTAAFSAADGDVTLNVPDGPLSVQLISSSLRAGLSQLAAEFTPNGLSKNGAPAGNLASLEFSPDGILSGVYDTGQRRALFQIPLATVPNPNGLAALDNQAFEISSTSGDVFFFDAGAGPAGEIVGFALQQSTVDVAEELTDMIVTQRAFSSNATVIRTVDEMLQETTNLKR